MSSTSHSSSLGSSLVTMVFWPVAFQSKTISAWYNSVCSVIDILLFFHALYLLSNSEDLSKPTFAVIAYLYLVTFWLISLQFGSHETLGGDVPLGKPTYVFPETLKNVVREIIPGALVDRPDPTHVNVSFFSFIWTSLKISISICL